MRVFLLDATLRQENEVRLLLLDEDGSKHLLTCANVKRIVHVVPTDAVTPTWISRVLFLLQKFSGGMARDFAHETVTKRYMTVGGALTEPVEMLRVSCSAHLSFSVSESDMIAAIFGHSTSLLEHVLVEHQLRGWLDFDNEAAAVTQHHRKAYSTTDVAACLTRCADQPPAPPFCVVAVHCHTTNAFAFKTRDGRQGEWLDSTELVAELTKIDPAVICTHGKHVMVGVYLNFPFVLVDTAAFAREEKLCYTKDLDDAVPVPERPQIVVDDDCGDVEEERVCTVVEDVPVCDALERCGAIFTVVDRTNAVDLTLKIATITGQPWSQTLRLESKLGRVEWMLMNTFHQTGCVVPNPRRYTTPDRYTAGLVLDAVVGIHENVILLDFRSLYPSVVVEYKLCWSADGAVLPRMLEYLIDRRVQLSSVPGSEMERLSLKFIANATYGALAFPAFRFYSPGIAATITARGREALQETATLVERNFACRVIYGDTDSVFVTSSDPGVDHDALGRTIAATVSGRYTKLELEYEARYRRLLLLGKKCYVAYTSGAPVLKGLALVKKQYFAAGKQIGHQLISMLSDDYDVREVSARARALAEQLVDDLKENRLRRKDLVVVNMLRRRPADYTHTAGMYHVLAAKASRMNYERGDYVRYIMFDGCVPVTLEMIDEVPEMGVDVKWYCARLHGMIEQITRVLPGFDMEPLAQLLLHGDLYEPEVPDVEYVPREREPLVVTCLVCQSEMEHWGLAKLEERLLANRCDTVSHLSPRCLFPERPLTGRIFLECFKCNCVLDLVSAVRAVEDGEQAASLHANYDCMRVARQINCRPCRRNLLQFLRNNEVMKYYDALRSMLFTW